MGDVIVMDRKAYRSALMGRIGRTTGVLLINTEHR